MPTRTDGSLPHLPLERDFYFELTTGKSKSVSYS